MAKLPEHNCPPIFQRSGSAVRRNLNNRCVSAHDIRFDLLLNVNENANPSISLFGRQVFIGEHCPSFEWRQDNGPFKRVAIGMSKIVNGPVETKGVDGEILPSSRRRVQRDLLPD